jgi:hypothetical protein
MAGHMGTGQVTVSNLVVVAVTADSVLVKGLIPGVTNSTVLLEKTGELKNPLVLYENPEEKAAREAKEAEAQAQPEEKADEPKEVKSEIVEPTPADTPAGAPTEAESTEETARPDESSSQTKETEKGEESPSDGAKEE